METSEKEIIEGNKLIAEFMGLKVIGNYAEAPNGINQYTFEYNTPISVKYHESWDWIMPVVEKISQMDQSEFNYEVTKMSEFNTLRRYISNLPITTPINEIWNEVVVFAEWYKNNK